LVHICAFYIQNNVQESIYENTSIKYLDNSNHLLYQRVYFIVFYSKCDISMDNSKLLLAYIQLYEQKFIINTWFVEEYILQSFEKLKTITFHENLEKRDVLIKSLYEVYVWSLWRVDFVGILEHIIFSQHQVLFGLFIDLDWLTFITFSMYVCMVIPYQHARLVGWRPN